VYIFKMDQNGQRIHLLNLDLMKKN